MNVYFLWKGTVVHKQQYKHILNVTFLICAATNAEGKVMKEVMSSQEFISCRLKRKHLCKAIVKGEQVRIRKETNNLALRSSGTLPLPTKTGHKEKHWDSYEARLPRA